ncbi:MAG: adaptor protein MecA [Lachnospiraceae bacterium]|nr:adaptor protein MecA [Lachnospiraceae bacterium]
MKIEKLNENQIRCTLTKEDLASRQLKISELAYGTEKAKNLFRDMMQQANYEFGFEAEDIPLMIEAVPLNGECIVLIITKVEDPEELDTRFSRFAPSVHEEADFEKEETYSDTADEVTDLFQKIQSADTETMELSKDTSSAPVNQPLLRLFRFSSMRPIISLCQGLTLSFESKSMLYKDRKNQQYLLLLTAMPKDVLAFSKLCNRISEYGSLLRILPTTEAYLAEHCEVIIAEDALKALAAISG